MIFSIPLSKLRPVAIFYEGDLYALAEFQLRTHDARYATKRSLLKRPTVYTLVTDFVQLFPEIPRSEIVEKLEEHGIGLEFAVEWDQIECDE